jgi:hypothetical protein
LIDLEIVRVGYGHPDAMLLIGEVQAEYVLRYGGPDATPLDPLMFEPPLGSFYVGYLELDGARRPVATGAARVVLGREGGTYFVLTAYPVEPR